VGFSQKFISAKPKSEERERERENERKPRRPSLPPLTVVLYKREEPGFRTCA